VSLKSPSELQRLIDSTRNKELQCRYYLQFARYLLIPENVVEFRRIETERVGNLGRSDYIISGTVWNGGEECVRSYIWELKAQMPIQP